MSSDSSDRRVTRPVVGLVVAATTTAILVAFVYPSLRADWYFDEAWRADMIRSSWSFERYRLHDTPIPPGWLAGNWMVFELLPSRRPLIRIVAHLPIVVTAWLLFDVLARTLASGRRGDTTLRTDLISAATVVLLLLTPAMAAPIMYLNNYTVDLLVAVALVWGCRAIVDGDVRRGAVAVVIAGVLAPLIAQGGALVLAAVLVHLLVRSSTDTQRSWLRYVPVVTGILAAVGGAVVALTLYLPVTRAGSVDDFWADESLAGLGAWGWIPRWWTTFSSATLPTWMHDLVVASLGLAVCLVVGVVVLARRFPLLVVAPISAQLLALGIAVITGWPVTVVRVNTAFQALIVMAAILGAVVCVVAVAERGFDALERRRTDEGHRDRAFSVSLRLPLAGIAMVAAVMVAWPAQLLQFSTSEEVFARGLSDDLTEIAAMSAPGDVIVGFHHMSSWYLHDVLVNGAAAPGVVVLDELEHGPEIVDDPSRVIADLAPGSHRVWCVLPFELGPEGTTARCRLDTPWEVVQEFRLRRATIVEAMRFEDRPGDIIAPATFSRENGSRENGG